MPIFTCTFKSLNFQFTLLHFFLIIKSFQIHILWKICYFFLFFSLEFSFWPYEWNENLAMKYFFFVLVNVSFDYFFFFLSFVVWVTFHQCYRLLAHMYALIMPLIFVHVFTILFWLFNSPHQRMMGAVGAVNLYIYIYIFTAKYLCSQIRQ